MVTKSSEVMLLLVLGTLVAAMGEVKMRPDLLSAPSWIVWPIEAEDGRCGAGGAAGEQCGVPRSALPVTGFDSDAHFATIRRQLEQRCGDYTALPGADHAFNISYYKNRASGCNAIVSMEPFGAPEGLSQGSLRFSVFFPAGFDFDKQGKLHGLWGARDGRTTSCFGGMHSDDCHSVRIMWTKNGTAYFYVYTDSRSRQRICDKYPTRVIRGTCGKDYKWGLVIDRGVVFFRTGVWHKVSLTVQLGPGDTCNLTLSIDKQSTEVTGIPLFQGGRQSLRRTMFTTFFGGSGPSAWPRNDTFSLQRAMRLRSVVLANRSSRPSPRLVQVEL
jgi:hypothetical protein